MIKLNKVKVFLKNAVISGVQSGLGGTHLGLRYGIDIVESTESMFMRRMTGQSNGDTVNSRRSDTNRKRLEALRMYETIKDNVKSTLSRTGTDSVVEEQIHYGDA